MNGRSMTGRATTARSARDRRRPRRWLAVAGYSLLALAGLAAAALAVVLVAPPLDAVRDRLVRQVERRTGRTLTVAGPMSVTLLPRPVVSIQGVALAPPQGMESAPTAAVPSIDAEMSLWSLLSRRPQLDRLTLHRPTIDLAIDAQGRRNWDIDTAKPTSPAAPAARASRDLPAGAKPTQAARRQRVRRPVELRVVDGTVRFRDARSGAQHEIGALNLDLTLDDAAGAMRAAGRLVWQGLPLEFTTTVAPGAQAANGHRAAQVMFALVGQSIDAAYEGTLAVDGAIAATGTVAIRRLAYKNWRIGPGTLGVETAAEIAKLTLHDLDLYGGRANGAVTLDTTAATPAIKADLQLAGLSLLPLLKDAAGAAWLDGTGTLGLALDTHGGSEQELLQALHGRVQLAVADGGITGLDVDRALRALQRGRLDRLAPRRGDRTPFQTLTASFDIADGVATNEDLKLASAHVQLDGAGKIELVPRRIDYTLHTKIEGGPSAEGGAIRIGTLEVPIAIAGDLEHPEFSIKGQEQLTDTLKQIGRNLRSREVQDAIGGLLSGDRSKRVKPADLLEKLFKKD